ncbi:hypothetical protein [Paraburkholderia tropica]|nr:hypothetical protein [Paraburkholderia tropica]
MQHRAKAGGSDLWGRELPQQVYSLSGDYANVAAMPKPSVDAA